MQAEEKKNFHFSLASNCLWTRHRGLVNPGKKVVEPLSLRPSLNRISDNVSTFWFSAALV